MTHTRQEKLIKTAQVEAKYSATLETQLNNILPKIQKSSSRKIINLIKT